MKNTPNTPARFRQFNHTNVSNRYHRSSEKYGERPTIEIKKSDIKAALIKNGSFEQTLLNTLADSLLWRCTKTLANGTRIAWYTLSNGIRTIYLKVKIFASGKFSINGAPVNAFLSTQLAKAIA